MISTFTVPRSIAVPIKMVINFYGFVLNILFTLLYIIPCMEGLLKINIKNADNFSIYLDATLFSLVMNLPISQWIILYGRSLENQINERVDGTCKLQSMVHKEIAPNWGTSTTCQHCINYNLCSRTNSIWYE